MLHYNNLKLRNETICNSLNVLTLIPVPVIFHIVVYISMYIIIMIIFNPSLIYAYFETASSLQSAVLQNVPPHISKYNIFLTLHNHL